MQIKNAVVLVTGANRGLGQAFVNALLQAGAAKIYAAARDPGSITLSGVTPIKLDITNASDIAAAAVRCTDLTLLINNAGIYRNTAFLAADSADVARAELETNFFGPLMMSKAFAPILKANGGGAIVNVLSVLSWLNIPAAATYSASKSAAWSLTNGLRNELSAQGTQVVGVHVGFMDTDMASGVDVPKAAPLDVARQTLSALEAGQVEVLADDLSRGVKQGLSAGAYLGQAG
ncbi:3-oxoacyl-[acyl-carrier-protein] reductase FabG [Ferriphaselus amnicola]|uniref:3-oxoacyl-[acyl-carrier-protein] reductase FabG n=1 Tax=Ferriphaselus amnicola TaxID=1188319 RepID=A0A2Z6GAR2_9PROT|nr:SDR family oxidoreductase [Ferriphaselus amnicola]BBE50527.1 3-oxoacyl-[acyl-carrier-protein] reductase FabG [Ferriphaselus amnicola]